MCFLCDEKDKRDLLNRKMGEVLNAHRTEMSPESIAMVLANYTGQTLASPALRLSESQIDEMMQDMLDAGFEMYDNISDCAGHA